MLLELGDLLLVDVDDHDVISEVGETGGGGEAYVTGSDDSDLAQNGPIIS
jgi:hypothetical protein